MTVPILAVTRRWYCPNCNVTDTTRRADAHTQMHTCAGLHGMTAPLFDVGARVKVAAVVRDDYVGTEDVAYDDNKRPVMAVETTRDEGNDLLVFAPAAGASISTT